MGSEAARAEARSVFVCLLAAAGLAWLLFGGLGHPLLWNDEADTAVFGARVLRHGLPVVSGDPTLAYHVRPEQVRSGGVYTAAVWGQYYLAALGVWLGEGVADVHERTARLRFVFAAVGYLSILGFAFAIAPLAGRGRARAFFPALLVLAACLSTSLLLHLREVRYYAPAVALVLLVSALHARRQLLGTLGFRSWLGAAGLGLFALFNVFPPVYCTLSVGLLLSIGLRSLREARGPARWRRWLWEASPIGVSGVLSIWTFWAMGLLEQADFASTAGTTRSYVENLRFILGGLLRFELLGPALLARGAVALAMRPIAEADSDVARRSEFSRFLLATTCVHVLAIAALPLVWERYLIVMSPLLSTALLLDGVSLFEASRSASGRSLRAVRALQVSVVAACLASVVVRVPEIQGRIVEIRVPVAGPLDAIIPYLIERHPDPERLVIATNYEGPAFSFYLGSHVIVGYYRQNLEADLELQPDVIVPRPWPGGIDALRDLSRRARYARVDFPVTRQRTNGSPILWPGSPGRVLHRFVAESPATERDSAMLLERVRDGDVGG